MDANEKWIGDELNGMKYPDQIYTLNAEIIRNTFSVESDQLIEKKVKHGYRFTRHLEYGLRLEAEFRYGKSSCINMDMA